MRKTVWVSLVLLLFTVTGFVFQPPATVRVVPQPLQAGVGETVTVELRVEQVTGLYGAEVRLKFDPDILEVVDADPNEEGVQLEPGTLPSPDYVVRNRADNAAGIVEYAVTQLPPSKPGVGSGVIARVTFRTKKVAVSELQFQELLLADTQGKDIAVVPQPAQIVVTGSSTWVFVAAGAALLLLVGGGIGFALIRRK